MPESVKARNEPLPHTHTHTIWLQHQHQNQSLNSLLLCRPLGINKVQLMLYRSISPGNQYFVLSLYLLHPSVSPDWDHTHRMYTTVLSAACLASRRDKMFTGNKSRETPFLLLLSYNLVLDKGNITIESHDHVVLYVHYKTKKKRSLEIWSLAKITRTEAFLFIYFEHFVKFFTNFFYPIISFVCWNNLRLYCFCYLYFCHFLFLVRGWKKTSE